MVTQDDPRPTCCKKKYHTSNCTNCALCRERPHRRMDERNNPEELSHSTRATQDDSRPALHKNVACSHHSAENKSSLVQKNHARREKHQPNQIRRPFHETSISSRSKQTSRAPNTMDIFHDLQKGATLTTILHIAQNPHVLYISRCPEIDASCCASIVE